MSLGTLGSTLNDELAAKQWANRENISPYSTDTVGVLNEIAGLGLDKKNWLDFNGVCNYIAGTSGLPAAAALRQIYPTTDLLTGVASYYVDAATPTNWGSLGYIALPGVNSNYLSIPDSAALDITSDIDIRWYGAMDDWTPASASTLIGKWDGALRSFTVRINADGTISFFWSADGTASNSATSTAPTGVTDGTFKWIRATLDVDNGASGKTVTFYTSDNGTSWTQLGTAVTTAGTTSIYASALSVTIGNDNNNANPLAGKVYRAQILNGIGGTTVLDVNIATDYKSSNLDTFTATTGQTVTVNGVGTVANYGAAGSLLPTTVGSSLSADSNDPKFLDHTGTNYVYVTGALNNFLSVPDAAPLDITGDIDLRAYVAMDAWASGVGNGRFITKYNGVDGNYSYAFGINSAAQLTLGLSPNGTVASISSVTSSASPTIANGAALWVRATYRTSDRRVQFFTSPDGTTWTQLGTDQTSAATSIFSSTSIVEIGTSASGTANFAAMKVYDAQIL